MKIIVYTAIAISLSGCFYQRVDQFDLQRSIKYCGTSENILEISSHSIGDVVVRCMNKGDKNLRNIEGGI